MGGGWSNYRGVGYDGSGSFLWAALFPTAGRLVGSADMIGKAK
jgi:hypothetical protein